MVSGACLVVSDACLDVSGGQGLPHCPFCPHLPLLHLRPLGPHCALQSFLGFPEFLEIPLHLVHLVLFIVTLKGSLQMIFLEKLGILSPSLTES